MVNNPSDADFKVGLRALYAYRRRGTTSFGFGDVEKVNRRTVVLVDCKHPGHERIMVDKALVYRLHEQSELARLDLVRSV